MKKFFLFAVAAVAVLASCSKNEPKIDLAQDDNAISFSAYTGSAATRGKVVYNTDVVATDKGIGVFAFYQPAASGQPVAFNTKKHVIPDFMYNQRVYPVITTAAVPYADVTEYNTAKGTSLSAEEFADLDPALKVKTAPEVGSWKYAPIKYWPNNKGDQVSFFAYAPYDPNKTWEDLGFTTDINATKLTATFPVYTEKSAMVDYVFATPALNKSKQKVAVDPDTQSADIINFNFKHIMSRVAINLGVITDKATGAPSTPEAWTDPDTKITVESIEFKGIAQSYKYTYTINATTDAESFTPSTDTQDFILTTTDFQNNVIDKTTYAAPTAPATMPWKTLLKAENGKPGYLFIAPQDLSKANLVITYKVETTDPATTPANPANNSTITNVVEKAIGVNFERGKAYVLNLLIGMKTVEIKAKVEDWNEVATATQIDVPANE